MTTLTFQTTDEARAWDAIVTELVGCYEKPDEVVSRADAMILERRKRMAPPAQIVVQESYNANSISPKWTDVEREWIPHKPGDPMPCDEDDYVMVMFRNHVISPARMQAIAYSWEETGAAFTIIAWRPA